MESEHVKWLSTRDPRLQTTITPSRQLLQPEGDRHIHHCQSREQTVALWEQETHDKEAHIKSSALCEDLRDVLDELGEILDEEQAALAFEVKAEITPPPPSICLDDDKSLFTRRSNNNNDRSATNIDKSLEILCRAKNLQKCEFIENRTTQIIKSPESNSQNKHKSSGVNARHDRNPKAIRCSSKGIQTSQPKSAIGSNSISPRPTSNERSSAQAKSKTCSSSTARHKFKSKDIRLGSDTHRNSRSSMLRNSPIRSRDWRRSASQISKYCKADQKRRNRRSQSKHRNSPIRYRDRRSISQNSKYYTADRLKVRNQRSQSKQRNSPIRYRDRRSISRERHRYKSSDRVKVRTRRRCSPRKRLDRRPTSRCRSQSPQNMRRSDYIKNPHTLQKERSWAEKIQRRRSSSSSPRRSHDFRRISRYSPLRLPRHGLRSRSNSRNFSKMSCSRSKSPRSNFPIRNVCNNRFHPAKIAMRSRSGSADRSRSKSVSSPAPFRKRSRSIDRSSNLINGPRLGSRLPRLRIRHSSSKKSSSHSMPVMDETVTAVGLSHQASLPGDQRLKPMKIASPVNSSPRPIVPMVTLHNNSITQPTSVQRQLLPTPTAPHTHFANIEWRTALSNQALRLPYDPIPANLAPIDLRHRLHTSRSLHYLGPNDLRDRNQNFCVQNTYLPPPAFNANAQWPLDYSIDYNSSSYY